MYIFLEYMPGGSVRLLLDRFGVFEEKMTLLYAKQLLRGLSFLHANGVAHRDIKVCLCCVFVPGSAGQKTISSPLHQWAGPVHSVVFSGAYLFDCVCPCSCSCSCSCSCLCLCDALPRVREGEVE